MRRVIALILAIGTVAALSACGKKEVEPVCEHEFSNPTYLKAEVCKLCGETQGEPLKATFLKVGEETEYETCCFDDISKKLTANVTVDEYNVEKPEDEELEGYSEHSVTFTVEFDDDKITEYGYTAFVDFINLNNGRVVPVDKNFSVSRGDDKFTDCIVNREILANEQSGSEATLNIRYTALLPEGYDTMAIVLSGPEYSDPERFDKGDEKLLMFRLGGDAPASEEADDAEESEED